MALFGRKNEQDTALGKPPMGWGVPGVQKDESVDPEMEAMLLTAPAGQRRIGRAEIAEAILGRAGIETERVEDGLQGVKRITEMPAGTYDMILMDIQMPRMDGYQAAQAIRALPDARSTVPIIAMTANAFEEDKQRAFDAGMNDHISKPISLNALLAALRKNLK